MFLNLRELLACEGLAKGPASRCNIVREKGASITSGNLEGEALSIEVWVALPVLTPVPWHWLPIGSWAFDGNCVNITSTTNVGD